MITQEQVNALYDSEVLDQEGEKVGSLVQVYVDNQTGDLAWVRVRTSWIGGRKVFVPLANAEIVDGQIRVPYPVEMIKASPDMEVDGHLDAGQQEDLLAYYSVHGGPAPAG